MRWPLEAAGCIRISTAVLLLMKFDAPTVLYYAIFRCRSQWTSYLPTPFASLPPPSKRKGQSMKKETQEVRANGTCNVIKVPTNRNELKNAMRKISSKPFASAQAHHGLPWKYREWFAKIGLNINDPKHGAWVKGGGNGGHQSWSKEYDNVWKEFIENNPNASANQVECYYYKIRSYKQWGGGF